LKLMKKNKKSSKNLLSIAYCGLYCPRCYKMKISASAKQLFAELKSAQNKGENFLQKLPQLKITLNKLIALECKKFCREGGGKSSTCVIKACCDTHRVAGCWKCPKFYSCKKLKPQFLANNKKLSKLSINKYIKQYK